MARQQKKSIGRWIGEAILIFLSVFGAFYFENLREERKEQKQYVKTLNAFKTDLETNVGKFNFELANDYDINTGRGFISNKQ